MLTWGEFLEDKGDIVEEGKKDWISGAIKKKGRCKDPGSEACPKGSPQYNLAMRFKKGDIHEDNLKKDKKKAKKF